MGKKNLIVLGNGFSIDLLNAIGKNNIINLKNLFSLGDKVPWPADGITGYLSYKHTPHLWEIGGQSTVDDEKATQLIEEIITTANMYTEIKKNKSNIDPTYFNKIKKSRYIIAYKELTSYLKQLFIYYNSLIDDVCLSGVNLEKWGWYRYFNRLQNDSEIDEVIIITYNYDIFLERIFKINNIPFQIGGIENTEAKFKIIKPHGSISFAHNTILPSDYSIKEEPILPEAKISDFKLDYTNMDKNYLIDAIIPPGGNSNRIDVEWAKTFREIVCKYAKNIDFNDEVMISGISYWHVDREEIDELLANIHPGVNITMINPSAPRTLGAVIESIFKNYILHSNSNFL